MNYMRATLLVFMTAAFQVCAYAQAESPTSDPPREYADLVILNANVIRCDKLPMSSTDAVAVKSGKIVALGSDDASKMISQESTQVLDAKGQTVTPGFVDSHLHFVGLGQSLQMLDLSGAKSWQEIVAQVKEASRLVPKGTWIEGRGWHQSKWSQPPSRQQEGYPHHESMSEAVPDHPVLLTHASGHACFANQLAMKTAGVTSETSDPPGGEILKDSAGNPLGVFRENAQGLVRRAKARTSQKLTDTERMELLKEQIRLAGEECWKHGITGVHDAGSSFSLASQMKGLAEANELPVRIFMMIRAGSNEISRRITSTRISGAGADFFTVRSIKVSIDGALGPHGAWLLQPYSDLPTTAGLNTVTLDELSKIAELCKTNQWQLCVHAIGDRANQEVLDVFEKTLGAAASSDHRWRIEHAQHLSVDDIPRFGSLGVIPAMQANHCTSDAIFVPTRLGMRRSEQGAYVWRSLIDSGAIIPNGTDAPVEKLDPRVSLFASVTRKLANGSEFFPEQCMTREEALLSYTLWPAKAAFGEATSGSIEVGKHADLVMWDTDLLNCSPDAILKAKVTRTIVAGKTVFRDQ